MIKKLLKYGTVAAVSFELGTIAQTHYLNYKAKGQEPERDRDLVWEGETVELKIPVDHAREMEEALTKRLEENSISDAIFAEEDIRSVRSKIAHGISDAQGNFPAEITIEVCDRERLRLLDAYLLVDGDNPLKPDSY